MVSQWKVPTSDVEPSPQNGTNSSSGELHSSETRRIPTR
jgi:hypothetical protein